MTVAQLVADLRLLPADARVVFESSRTIVLVSGASPNRVHLGAGIEVARHHAENCGGCARHLALVAAVSLLGHEPGGPNV